MVVRPLDLIISDLIQEIQAVLPSASTMPGSVVREAFVNPPAAQISQMYSALDTVRQAQTISEATGTDLDRLASNFGLTRDTGRSAVGELTLVLADTITSANLTVNNGVSVSTDERTGSAEFSIIGTYIFRPIDKDYYAAEASRLKDALQTANITNASYVATVPIQALRSGSNGNVGPYMIVRCNIPGVRTVTNLSPTVGGTDVESDASLRRRISLVLGGSGTGTVDGLTSLALSVSPVTDANVIRPGDPLMTRDGSIYDTNGNLVKAGTGRSVDLYIKGSAPITNTETLNFTDLSNGESVTSKNNLVLGYDEVSMTNSFAKQPIKEILDLTGSLSGANFKKGQQVIDSEGNVILVGNYVLLSDIAQEIKDAPLMIVKDNITGETKVAIYLSPISNRYSLIQTLSTSSKGNSALGLDSIFWLTNVATITDEGISRGNEYNGSDSLAHSNVAQIQSIDEDVTLTKESIVILDQGVSQNAFVIFTKHYPLTSIAQVRHSRLGFNYDYQILDASLGKIQLIGRFAPQVGDIIQISYVWRQNHLQNIEYFLQGNNVKWARSPYERATTEGLSLLGPTTIVSPLTLQIQPLIPTYLGLQTNQLTARAQYNMTIFGDKARIANKQGATYSPSILYENKFLFNTSVPQSATASKSRLARVVGVRNLTKGFAYSTENMSLNTNLYDPTVGVVESLSDSQFLLDETLNVRHMNVGDKILFSRKSSMRHWTTTSDFTNNILSNTAPVYDSVITSFDNDEITVKRHEDDLSSPSTVLSGSISQSGTLSGLVDIVDDVIIEPGVMIVLQPNTVVRFTDSKSLNSIIIAQDKIELDSAITIGDIDSSINLTENTYVFEQPTNSTSPFFIILNNAGTEAMSIFYHRDVIHKVVATRDVFDIPTSYDYYINDRLVSVDFLGTPMGAGLIAALTTTSTFLGHKRDNGDTTFTFISKLSQIGGRSQYGIPVAKTPRLTGTTSDDFTFYASVNPDAIFTDTSYDQDRNLFLVGPLAIETNYILEYFIEIVRRLSLRVRGTLRVSPDVTENTPVVFTSAATTAAPGDWEGIIFEPSSHTNASGNPFGTSYLINSVIKYARVGIQNNTSDPYLDLCIIKQCLDGCYTAISGHFAMAGYTETSFRLLSNDFTPSGRSYVETRYDSFNPYGYGPTPTSTRTLSLRLTDLLSTLDGNVPSLTKVGYHELLDSDLLGYNGFASKYVANMVYGTDYKVYLDGSPIDALPLPLLSLTPDVDFALEYDRQRGGYLVSFFNTTQVLNLLVATTGNPNVIRIDYEAVYDNGSISNSIINNNGNCGFDISKLSAVALRGNTINGNQFYGAIVNNSYLFVANNLITNYAITPILQDTKSIANITTSNMWSLPILKVEENEVSEIDVLGLAAIATDTILTVGTPSLYKRNTIIKIDEEFMQVQDILGDRISVTRGYNGTTPTAHSFGVVIYLQRTKVIFTVAGVPGNFCSIREVANDGSLLTGREPITMLKIADNTFRISFSVDRSATFYYRFQYKENITDSWWNLTETRKIIVAQFGNAVYNFINADHETHSIKGSFDLTNYSDNPLYGNPSCEDFSIPSNSPSSAANPIYAIPYDPIQHPEPRLVFLGRAPILQEVTLTVGMSSIVLNNVPIVITSLSTDITIQMVSNPDRKLIANAYNPTTRVLTLSTPVTSANVGIYNVLYYTPTTLGTQISPFPLSSSILYQYNEQKVVNFTKLVWRNAGDSGAVSMRFRVANSTADLANQAMSAFSSESPFDLSFGTDIFPRGSIIEIEVVVKTNDAGFSPDRTPLFPKLQDFSLFLTPARDNVLYNILSTNYDTKTNKTLVNIDDSENAGLGIRTSTFTTVGTDDILSVILRKAEDGFVESKEFVVGEVDAIAAGETQIKMVGNVILERSAPDVNDTVEVDLIYADLDDSEQVAFIENGTQVTSSRFYAVREIDTQVILDKVEVDLATETLSIVALDQPAPGSQYLTDYTFAAPLDGEQITTSYTYNSAVRNTAQPVDSQKVLTSDVLVREAISIPLTIEASVFIGVGFNPTSIVVDISNALATFLESRASFGGTILITDIEAVMTNVTGVESVKINTLSRTPAKQVVDIVLSAREYAVLASSNPLLTIALSSNPTQVLPTNSV